MPRPSESIPTCKASGLVLYFQRRSAVFSGGGSTMLMLQALLPCMLAKSKGEEVEVVFKGGTNVCSPPGKGQLATD